MISSVQDNALFGAQKISFEELTHLEKNSPDVIVYAIPVMAFLTFAEIGYSWYMNHKNFKTKESLGSTLVGLGNVGINLVLKVALLYGAVWAYNVVPWRMALNWWTIIPCYLIFDLFSYWSHRVSHSSRFFWATHVVHHSAENYNLTVSFRLSWIQNLKIIFFVPIAFFGFHPVVFFTVSQIAVLFQFWVHTEYIKKLHPFIEYIFATPSNHRVHHGSQEHYLDKNYAATFIFWDRIFGTFEPEGVAPEYGLTTKIGDRLDPLFLNFHEVKDMVVDVKKAKGIREKLFYIFASPSKIHRVKVKEALALADKKQLLPRLISMKIYPHNREKGHLQIILFICEGVLYIFQQIKLICVPGVVQGQYLDFEAVFVVDKMKKESEGQMIVRVMNTDLKFVIDDTDILPKLLAQPDSVHLNIHIDKQIFYYEFFNNICRQLQLLIALGDKKGAEYLLIDTKNELCITIQKASKSSHVIVFCIPILDDCVNIN